MSTFLILLVIEAPVWLWAVVVAETAGCIWIIWRYLRSQERPAADDFKFRVIVDGVKVVELPGEVARSEAVWRGGTMQWVFGGNIAGDQIVVVEVEA